jgi:acyl carrier protein
MQKYFSQEELVVIFSRALTETLTKSIKLCPDPIDTDAPLKSFGLDSLAMVSFLIQIEEVIGIELEQELLFQYPTIHALSKFVSNMPSTENA